jgi:hypothetical protein
VCFSPQGDLAGGLIVTAIGIDAIRHLRGREEYKFLAPLPIALGLHQLDETFVWWQLQGHVPRTVGVIAMWIYLVFAFVVLPIVVPGILWLMETQRQRRWILGVFTFMGVGVSVTLLATMLAGNPTAKLATYHVAYSIGLHDGLLVVGLYVVATCGALLASSRAPVRNFGLINLVAVVILARLAADGFTSLWCFYAAVVSGAIALLVRTRYRLESDVSALATPTAI